MKKLYLTAASTLAIAAVSYAHAGETQIMNSNKDTSPAMQSTGSLTQDLDNAWEATKDGAKDMTDSLTKGAKSIYSDAKQAIKDDDSAAEIATISNAQGVPVSAMLGETLYNFNGEAVAQIEDIVLDEAGNAVTVILRDGEILGLGKRVAFGFDVISSRNADGQLVSSLDEQTIDASTAYDANSANVSGMYSVSDLLDGRLVTPSGQTLAQVDDIMMQDGEASHIVVGFNQAFGLGGEKAAIAFKEADLDADEDGVDFKLSANEASDFKAYQETVLN